MLIKHKVLILKEIIKINCAKEIITFYFTLRTEFFRNK